LFALNLATGVAGWLGLAVYARRLQVFQMVRPAQVWGITARAALAAAPAGGVAYLVAVRFGVPAFFLHNILPLALGGLAGLLVFVGLAYALRLPLRLR
jgi:putative peptidoglycan lipid II flippase